MANKISFWLVKQEPSKYSWETFLQDGETYWDGVRNYQARNNLQSMKKGDLVFFYHSVTGKEIKGIAKVTREAYPDPTTDDSRWVVVGQREFLCGLIERDENERFFKLKSCPFLREPGFPFWLRA